jgi:hypothetical protein
VTRAKPPLRPPSPGPKRVKPNSSRSGGRRRRAARRR